QYGWRAAMLAAASVATIAALAWWLWAPEPPSEAPSPTAQLAATAADPTLHHRSFWLLCLSYFLQSYLGYIFIFWFLSYLVDVRGVALLRAAWVSTLPWLATLLAIPLGGLLSDLAVERWGATRGRRSLPVAAFVLASIALVIGARTRSAPLA